MVYQLAVWTVVKMVVKLVYSLARPYVELWAVCSVVVMVEHLAMRWVARMVVMRGTKEVSDSVVLTAE